MRGLTAALCGVTVLLASACGSSSSELRGDPLQAVDNPVAASPARAPQAADPDGTVLPLPGAASTVVADPRSRTLAVALDDRPVLLLYRLDRLRARPHRIDLPGPAASVNLVRPGGPLLAAIPSRGVVRQVALPDGTARTLRTGGEPTFAARYRGQTLVTLPRRKAVRVMEPGGEGRTITGELYSADQVLVSGGRPLVFDRVRNALFELDLEAGDIGKGQRVGDGGGQAVADGFGRVLVTDTRGNSLLAFSADPLLMRQRYPVPGTPYGIAYDRERDVAWVTLTGRNQVVAYDVAGGEPAELDRFGTPRQPNGVTVDGHTGRVFVVSATGDGLQVVQP